MSIRTPIPKEKLGTEFTHYGWLFGVLPVYVANPESEAPMVVERNWVPEFAFGMVQWLGDVVLAIGEVLAGRDLPVGFSILITGPIHAASKDTQEG